MFYSLLKGAIILIFLIPTQISAQASNIPISKAVKYRDNVNAPLTQSELEKINEVYQNNTKDQVLERPMHLKRIKHLLRNRIRIITIDRIDKQRGYQLMSEVELFNHYNSNLKRDVVFNKETFNPLKYSFEFFAPIPKMYRVDGTNYFIQIKSQFQE